MLYTRTEKNKLSELKQSNILKYYAVNPKSRFISKVAIQNQYWNKHLNWKLEELKNLHSARDFYLNVCFTFLGDKNSHSKTPKFVIIYSIHEVKWSIHIIYQQHYNITTQGKIMIKYVTQWTSHFKYSDLTYSNPVTTFGFSHSSSCILCNSLECYTCNLNTQKDSKRLGQGDCEFQVVSKNQTKHTASRYMVAWDTELWVRIPVLDLSMQREYVSCMDQFTRCS